MRGDAPSVTGAMDEVGLGLERVVGGFNNAAQGKSGRDYRGRFPSPVALVRCHQPKLYDALARAEEEKNNGRATPIVLYSLRIVVGSAVVCLYDILL